MTNKKGLDDRLNAFSQPQDEYQLLREKLAEEATRIAAKHGLIVSLVCFGIGTAIWRFPISGNSHPFYPIPIIAIGMAVWSFYRSRSQLMDLAESEIEDLKKEAANNR